MSVLTAGRRWISHILLRDAVCLQYIQGGHDIRGVSYKEQRALSVPAVALKTPELPSLLRLVVVTLNINRCITNTCSKPS